MKIRKSYSRLLVSQESNRYPCKWSRFGKILYTFLIKSIYISLRSFSNLVTTPISACTNRRLYFDGFK